MNKWIAVAVAVLLSAFVGRCDGDGSGGDDAPGDASAEVDAEGVCYCAEQIQAGDQGIARELVELRAEVADLRTRLETVEALTL